jgi:hypothetical protein
MGVVIRYAHPLDAASSPAQMIGIALILTGAVICWKWRENRGMSLAGVLVVVVGAGLLSRAN